MKFEFENKSSGKPLFLIFTIATILFSLGCEPPPANTTVNANTNVSNTNVTTTKVETATTKESTMKMPVTLPVLDAMFADESFAADLKSKLQLTDEQIDKLKTVSRQAVSNLREDESDTQVGSTRASIERADKQIRETLGDEKANKLFELVSQRWAGEDAGNPADTAQGKNSKRQSR